MEFQTIQVQERADAIGIITLGIFRGHNGMALV